MTRIRKGRVEVMMYAVFRIPLYPSLHLPLYLSLHLLLICSISRDTIVVEKGEEVPHELLTKLDIQRQYKNELVFMYVASCFFTFAFFSTSSLLSRSPLPLSSSSRPSPPLICYGVGLKMISISLRGIL